MRTKPEYKILLNNLYLIQQDITVFHHRLVLRVLQTWMGGLDDAADFADGGM